MLPCLPSVPGSEHSVRCHEHHKAVFSRTDRISESQQTILRRSFNEFANVDSPGPGPSIVRRSGDDGGAVIAVLRLLDSPSGGMLRVPMIYHNQGTICQRGYRPAQMPVISIELITPRYGDRFNSDHGVRGFVLPDKKPLYPHTTSDDFVTALKGEWRHIARVSPIHQRGNCPRVQPSAQAQLIVELPEHLYRNCRPCYRSV